MATKVCTKTALVTGGASGIGLGIATYLAQAGYRVYLTDLNGAAANKAAASIEGEITALALDVSDVESIDALAQLVGTVDLLVNNAGIQHVAPLEQFPVHLWKRIIDVLLTGPALLTRALLPGMRRQGFGRIVNIGSIHALIASPYKSAYVAAKHGLLSFSKTLALETADTDITINTVCPAYVKTPLVEQQISAQAKAHGISEVQVAQDIMLKPMPKKSFIGMDEITAAVTYLASPEARHVTGQTLVIDGGWTAQ